MPSSAWHTGKAISTAASNVTIFFIDKGLMININYKTRLQSYE